MIFRSLRVVLPLVVTAMQIREKWSGIVCLIAGCVLLAAQVFIFFTARLVNSWLVGGGIGLIAMGTFAWLHYLGDKRAGVTFSRPDELPNADEYDRLFEGTPPPELEKHE